jgi:TRAP-type C4-dicarboxylate transport system permease small subunit
MESATGGGVIAAYQKFADAVYVCIRALCKIICAVMVLSVFYAVLGRFILPTTPRWCEEVGILCMVWICFLSSTMAIRDGIHVRMDILDYILPRAIAKALHALSYVALLILCLVWIYAGWEVVEMTLRPRMPSTQLPQAVLYGSVFASGIFGVVMTLSRLLRGGW